jgi:hypothetical protein
MPLSENEPRSSESANDLEVINRNKEGDFLVKHHQTGSICTIVDTFAEMFTAMEISPARPLLLSFMVECRPCFECLCGFGGVAFGY